MDGQDSSKRSNVEAFLDVFVRDDLLGQVVKRCRVLLAKFLCHLESVDKQRVTTLSVMPQTMECLYSEIQKI